MKKLMFAALAAASFCAAADDAAKAAETETESSCPIAIWGFGNYGIYSGYQLYGSLVNSEPVLQGYAEVNAQFSFDEFDLGYAGVGLWLNSDLTSRRGHMFYPLGRGFPNEYDPNIHFGRTFWFDDDKTWGLDWRSTFVWFYYPPHNYHGARHTPTTWDFDHSFALINPYVIPFIDVVREYSNGANLLQFGLKKPIDVAEGFSLTPSITMVWRERQYNWCFPTQFGSAGKCNSGIATLKVMLDASYWFNDYFGLFAKVAYCSIIDPDLRDNIDNDLHGADYGKCKDYAWGGIGVQFKF